jgi:hypothetical protein
LLVSSPSWVERTCSKNDGVCNWLQLDFIYCVFIMACLVSLCRK